MPDVFRLTVPHWLPADCLSPDWLLRLLLDAVKVCSYRMTEDVDSLHLSFILMSPDEISPLCICLLSAAQLLVYSDFLKWCYESAESETHQIDNELKVTMKLRKAERSCRFGWEFTTRDINTHYSCFKMSDQQSNDAQNLTQRIWVSEFPQ